MPFSTVHFSYIDTMFEEGNACLKNSLVPMRLVHHGTYFFEGEEIRDASGMLDKFAGITKTAVTLPDGQEAYTFKPNVTRRDQQGFNRH